jgi:hypothetical protein
MHTQKIPFLVLLGKLAQTSLRFLRSARVSALRDALSTKKFTSKKLKAKVGDT